MIAKSQAFGKIPSLMENVLEKINKSAVKFLVPLTTEETFKIIATEAKKIINGEYCAIFLEKDGELERVYVDADFLQNFKQRRRGLTYNTFQTKEPKVVAVDKNNSPHKEIIENGIQSIVHIPLAYKDKAIGVLTIHSLSPQEFSKRDLHTFALFGSLASMAIRKTQLYDETKNALETRDLFISLASHELRTPLTSINGYIDLLHSRIQKGGKIEKKWVSELYDESKRLTSLVSELLEINRIKQGQLLFDLRECKIEDFMDSAIARYTFINPDRKIVYNNLIKDSNVSIIGDCKKLMQMVTALLNNADKFSHPSQPITITVKHTKSHLTIFIRDEGIGISAKDLPRVFEGFYKGDVKESSGLGVGLLLAKHICQYHHGTIVMKSKKGKGSQVDIKLPLLKT